MCLPLHHVPKMWYYVLTSQKGEKVTIIGDSGLLWSAFLFSYVKTYNIIILISCSRGGWLLIRSLARNLLRYFSSTYTALAFVNSTMVSFSSVPYRQDFLCRWAFTGLVFSYLSCHPYDDYNGAVGFEPAFLCVLPDLNYAPKRITQLNDQLCDWLIGCVKKGGTYSPSPS